MKKIIILCLIIMTTCMACEKKPKEFSSSANNKESSIQVYYTQPVHFSKILSNLDALGSVDYTRILNTRISANPKSMEKVAFNLGSGVADALLCVKAKNTDMILSIAQELVTYAEILGVSKDFLQLADSMKYLLEQENWAEVETNLEKYRERILDELYGLENFDSVILLHFGGWINGLHAVTDIISTDLNGTEGSELLRNKTVLVALEHDLTKLQNSEIKKQAYYAKSLAELSRIKEIIFSVPEGTYTKTNIQELYDRSTEILNLFQ